MLDAAAAGGRTPHLGNDNRVPQQRISQYHLTQLLQLGCHALAVSAPVPHKHTFSKLPLGCEGSGSHVHFNSLPWGVELNQHSLAAIHDGVEVAGSCK